MTLSGEEAEGIKQYEMIVLSVVRAFARKLFHA